MKWFTLILSLYVLVLSFAPCCKAEEDKSNMPLSVGAEQDDCSHENNHSDNCSPFVHCNCCTGFIIPVNIPKLYQAERDVFEDTPFRVISPFSIALPFWQPPKLS